MLTQLQFTLRWSHMGTGYFSQYDVWENFHIITKESRCYKHTHTKWQIPSLQQGIQKIHHSASNNQAFLGSNWILGLFPAGHFLEITTAGNESNLRKMILRYLIMSCPMENHPFRKMILPYVFKKKLEIASLPLLSCGWETQFVVPNRSSFLDTHAHSSEALRDSLLHCILM